jgi:hypothetical protein
MRKLYVSFLVLVLALALVIPAGAVNAGSKHIQVSGEIELIYVPDTLVLDRVVGAKDPVMWEDSIMMGTFVHEVTYTGDINGIAYETINGMWNTKKGEYPCFQIASNGIQEFTGLVLDKSGTFTARVRHQGRETGEVRIEQTILSGTGDLANLHGTLIFTVYPIEAAHYKGTYSGKLHFAP